ncbi:MAG: secretin N-terminal domain-containing protein, partial [Pirellulales bacterium]
VACPQPPTALAVQPTNGLAAPAGTVVVQLRNLPGAELHKRLEQLLSQQLPASVDASGEWQGFAVEASPGVGVTMSVNNRSGQVRIDGPTSQVAAWRSVVEAMDSPPATAGVVTQLVTTKPASHDRVRKALNVLQASSGTNPQPDASLTAMMQQPGSAAQPAGAAPSNPAAAPPAAQVVPSDAQTAIDAVRVAEAAGNLLGPVDVTFVEGLDVIVLRGAERDVQRVMEIINEIEQLSAVTVPAIEIYELKNVESVQLAALLNQLYTQVLAARIGTVSITALGKPNALLLVGRTENVQMAIDLVKRLDQPVAPFGRFEVFSLQNASATEAKTIVDGFLGQAEGQAAAPAPGAAQGEAAPTLAPRALVVADPRTNALIVSASPRDLAEIAALINRIDTPGVSATMKVFAVRNGDATSLTDTLRTLFGVSEDQSAAGPGLSQGGPVRVQFSVDQRTNSIIAVGTQDDLTVVEAILLRLDEGELRERINEVYRLKNAYAVDVATALNNLLQTERTAESEADLAISPFEQIEREVVIVPETASNSLVVSATPRYYERIKRLIEDLDERPPMVLIQVLIAEVRLNDTDQFGVELGLQDKLLFDRSLLGDLTTISTTTQTQSAGGATVSTTQDTIVNAPGNPGYNFNNPNAPLGNNLSDRSLLNAGSVAAQGLSNFAVNRLDPTLGFSGFVFSASSDAVSILLRALQENRRLEVLSRPQLMALDGQPGYVQVGQDVPTITATQVDALSGTINSITYRQVGLILEVIPRISPDGLVVMQITANKSEVGPEIEGIPISVSPAGAVLRAPRIEVTQARTTISALSGQTVVLGGLIQTRKGDVHRRVPIISDIPLIGNFFRYDSVSDERRELLIVMTPQIIYNKLDSDLVKQIESSRMSWCLSDVVNVHGEAGLRSRCDEWFDGETEAVYPNYVPQDGELLPLPGNQMTPTYGPVMQMPVIESDGSIPGGVEMLPMPSVPAASPLPTPPPPTESQPGVPLIPPQPVPPQDAQPMSLDGLDGSAFAPSGHHESDAKFDLRAAFNTEPRRLPEAESTQ